MKIYLLLVACLAGAAWSKSVQEVEDVLQALREALADVGGNSGLGKRTEEKTVEIKVSENGVVFAEQISFDDVNKCETLHVPAHNGRLEADIRHCFNEGKSLYCFPTEKACYLLDMEDEGEPGLEGQEDGINKFEEQKEDVLDAATVDIQPNQWVITGKAERTDLSESLAKFKEDFPVFFAAKLPEDAVILPSSDDEADDNDKRQLVVPGSCSNGPPIPMYAATNRNGCEYLVFCDGHNSQYRDCPRRHVTDSFFLSCLCCRGTTRKEDCLFCQDLRCNFGAGGLGCN